MSFDVTICTPAHLTGIDTLWRVVFPDDPPWNAAALAGPAKLAMDDDLFLVALDGVAGVSPIGLTPHTVIGTCMAGWDGHRGWLYAVAVHPDQRQRGIAQALVTEALVRLRARGCTKVNLQVRAGNDGAVAFWRSMGFAIEERVSLGLRLD